MDTSCLQLELIPLVHRAPKLGGGISVLHKRLSNTDSFISLFFFFKKNPQDFKVFLRNVLGGVWAISQSVILLCSLL